MELTLSLDTSRLMVCPPCMSCAGDRVQQVHPVRPLLGGGQSRQELLLARRSLRQGRVSSEATVRILRIMPARSKVLRRFLRWLRRLRFGQLHCFWRLLIRGWQLGNGRQEICTCAVDSTVTLRDLVNRPNQNPQAARLFRHGLLGAFGAKLPQFLTELLHRRCSRGHTDSG